LRQVQLPQARPPQAQPRQAQLRQVRLPPPDREARPPLRRWPRPERAPVQRRSPARARSTNRRQRGHREIRRGPRPRLPVLGPPSLPAHRPPAHRKAMASSSIIAITGMLGAIAFTAMTPARAFGHPPDEAPKPGTTPAPPAPDDEIPPPPPTYQA